MHPNIAISVQRSEKLLAELLAEYNASLHAKTVSPKAVHLTHEICERGRSVLDRIARRYWELRIAPSLTEDDVAKAAIYFPIAGDEQGLDSTLGRWRWKTVKDQHAALYSYLSSYQPFKSPENAWLSTLNELAVQGKHIDLVPQTRSEQQRVTVTGQNGGVISWGPAGVTFEGSVSVMGAPVDPRTQRIIPTAGVTEAVEVWVSFKIDAYNVDAAEFCKTACTQVRKIAEEMTARYGLA